jgi:predicted ATPase
VQLYDSLIASGKIRPDPRQGAVVSLMQNLGDELERGGVPRRNSTSSSWFSRAAVAAPAVTPLVQGLYIYGGCGTGKTMLMDLFFKEVSFDKKKRVHFHGYMIDVHQRLFRMQRSDASRLQKCDTQWTAASADAQRVSVSRNSSSCQNSDLVERVADSLLCEARLLCFDEFQVTNISDAVIMRRLFSIMFEKGVVVVATSNRPPEDLYLNGLNRELFVPFIPLLKDYCIVHNMDSATDYRQLTTGSDQDTYKVYFAPLVEAASARLESKFFQMAQNDIDYDNNMLEVQGRSIAIRRAAKNSAIAWFTFNELCDKPLGSADYISIAKRYHTVFLEGIPKLTMQERDQVRRFITLIDALYDHGTKLVCSSDSIIMDDIFEVDDVTRKSSTVDEIFAWDRTVSRLTEMTSVEYLIRHIRKLTPQEFFGQFDLDAHMLPEADLRQIFVRYDKNNDSVIAVAGLNRMVSDLDHVVSGGKPSLSMAAPSVLEKLSKDGRRIHFDVFRKFVDENGLVSGLLKSA